MAPLITVVIPTYNHAKFLERALLSVLDQTYANWEALVIDNHSKDNTVEVVKNFNDPRIRLIKIQNHGVIAASRNEGIRNAKGEWIAFLDSDDLWYCNKLEVIVEYIRYNKYDVLINNELCVNINTGAKKLMRYGPFQKDFYKILLIEGNRLSTSATVVKKDYLAENGLTFNESVNYITVEDYGLWLDLARYGAKFYFITEVHGEYVIHGGNTSAQISLHMKNMEALLYDHVFNIQAFHANPKKLWIIIISKLRIRQAFYFMVDGQRIKGLKLFIKTLYKYPIGIVYFIFKLKKFLIDKIT